MVAGDPGDMASADVFRPDVGVDRRALKEHTGERLSMSSPKTTNLEQAKKFRSMRGGEMLSTRHEPVYHATHGCQAASLSLTAVRLRGRKWACQVESPKNAGFLAHVAYDQHDLELLGGSASMLLLRLLKGHGFIAGSLDPHGKDDPHPHVSQRTDRNGVAFAFCAFALIIVSGPWFTLRRLPSELMQGIPQGFDTAQPSMGFGVDPALIQHGRGSTQRLQTAGILVALAIIPDFCQQSRSQALACTWQALKDLMVLMGQKKGGNLLVVLSNLCKEWQQLTHQSQHQARFGPGDDGIGLQMRLLQALNDLGGDSQGIGMTCFLEDLRDLVCRGALGGLRSGIGLQKHQGGVLLDLREQLQRDGIVGFEASRELIHQTSLGLDQGILITGEQFQLGHLLAIRSESVQIGKVRSSCLGQQIRINRIRFGSRGRTPSINGPGIDRINWPAYFQQVRDQQAMRRLDDARHLLFGRRADDLLQKGVQLAHPLRAVIDPQRTDLTSLLIDDQSVMVRVRPINTSVPHQKCSSLQDRFLSTRALILWRSKRDSLMIGLAQEQCQGSASFLNRSNRVEEGDFPWRVQQL